MTENDASNWKLAAGGTQLAAAKIEFSHFIAAISEKTFKAFIHDVCIGDGFAQILLSVGDPDEVIDQLITEIYRESRQTRERLTRWAQLRGWQKMAPEAIRRYLCIAKALPGIISPETLRRFINDEHESDQLHALAASAIGKFPPEAVYSIWKKLQLHTKPECLGAALVSIAQIDPHEALEIARHVTESDYERIAYSIVTVVQLLVEHSSDPIELRRSIDRASALPVVFASYEIAGLPLPAAIASMSRLDLNVVTEREFVITKHQFGVFEQRIRRWREYELCAVRPLIPRLDVPNNGLRKAVLAHIDAGIPYTFYMPSSIDDDAFADQLGTYRTLVRAQYSRGKACDEKLKLISGIRLPNVAELPYPYVFYELKSSRQRIILGLRGAERDCGIASHYYPIEAPEAETILALVGGRINWPNLVGAIEQDSQQAVRELLKEAAA